jgi:beta-glucosidase
MQALRADTRQALHIGVAEAYQAPIPLFPQREDYQKAALAAGRDALFLRPLFEGHFSPWDEEAIERCGLLLTDADRDCVTGKLDFLGLNSYNPKYVRPADNSRGYEEVRCSSDHPKIGPDWLRMDPDILYWGPRLVHELWSPDAIYITENGCAGVEEPDDHGEVNDTHRYLQIRTHLQSAARCVAEGIPLRGYFHWSTLDNFEWSDGYQHRFGLIHVDYTTLKRTPS